MSHGEPTGCDVRTTLLQPTSESHLFDRKALHPWLRRQFLGWEKSFIRAYRDTKFVGERCLDVSFPTCKANNPTLIPCRVERISHALAYQRPSVLSLIAASRSTRGSTSL
jgi:hypothetical protein